MGGQLSKKNLNLSEKRRETEELGRGRKDVEREEVVKKTVTSDGGK